MIEVIAREAELAAGDAFLDRLASDGPQTLILDGEAGIGKTAVWTEIGRRAAERGYLVLVTRPAAAEIDLTLSAIGDLLGGLPADAYAELPEPQRRALDAALLRAAEPGPLLEGRVLGTAVRALLETLAANRPVVLAIDDMQWVDPASATTIGYAIRRVVGARVGVLATRRTGEPIPDGLEPLASVGGSGGDGDGRIGLGPLSVAALHHLLRQRLDEAPSRPTLVRVHQASGGNPFFALEIVRLLRDVGEPPAGDPLPVPADVRDLIRERIARLPAATRQALLALAATGDPRLSLIQRALGRDPAADLEVAVDGGIVRADGDRVTFRHPLFRAAIYGAATAEQRREIHRALAAAVGGGEEAARHAALASPGPDPIVAAALEDAATDADRRAAPASAAGLIELAIRLTPPGDAINGERRALALGRYTLRAGAPRKADAVLDRLIETAASAETRVRARLALAAIRFDNEVAGQRTGAQLCQDALADDVSDREQLAHVHATLAAVSWDDFERRQHHAAEAVRLIGEVTDPDPLVLGMALSVKLGADAEVSGEPFDPAIVERLLALEQIAAPPSVSDRFSASLGTWLKYNDDFVGGRHWLELTYQAAIDEGDESSLAYALGHLPQLELWTGDWPKAEAYALEHLRVSAELRLETQRRQALYNVAIVHVHQGRVEAARAEIAEAMAAADADDDGWTPTLVLPALALLEGSLGEWRAAIPALERANALRDETGDSRPRRHDADLVEAFVAVGDLPAAAAALEAGQRRASYRRRHTALANMGRARAVLLAARGDLDGAIEAANAALTEHALAEVPFDRARTMLVLGQLRRRRRERRAGKAALDDALATFERLGARLWAEKTRAELARLGLRRGASGDELTGGEQRVAELAATGLTNREVAAALFMSPKTVEAHLARAYQKLGITSRAELGAVVGRPAGAGRGGGLQT